MDNSKINSPLLGYNTNIKHGGHLFHIQTEDSGRDHPHVITHLFTEGTILSSKKTAYNEHLNAEDFEDKVRALMKNQHKTMFVELRDGIHDEIAEKILGHALDHSAHAASKPADKKLSKAGFQIQGEDTPPATAQSPAETDPGSSPRITVAPSSMSKGMSIFESPGSDSSFGDSLISDKSLDEVILNYLSDELDD
jgi:hypothetical protein